MRYCDFSGSHRITQFWNKIFWLKIQIEANPEIYKRSTSQNKSEQDKPSNEDVVLPPAIDDPDQFDCQSLVDPQEVRKRTIQTAVSK